MHYIWSFCSSGKRQDITGLTVERAFVVRKNLQEQRRVHPWRIADSASGNKKHAFVGNVESTVSTRYYIFQKEVSFTHIMA